MTGSEHPDPLLEEVDEMRRRMFAECGDDLHRLFEELREDQKQFSGRLISDRERGPDNKSVA